MCADEPTATPDKPSPSEQVGCPIARGTPDPITETICTSPSARQATGAVLRPRARPSTAFIAPSRGLARDGASDTPPDATPLSDGVPPITLYLTTLDPGLIPSLGTAVRDWWKADRLTHKHAVHCQPLRMANTLGYYVRSPGSFRITWDGGDTAPVTVDHPAGARFVVDSHSAHGSFTVQPGFVARTSRPGDFLLIKSLPNQRRPWFTAMDALIEAWWQPGEFGLVCLLNRPGEFVVERGEPLAQMALYRAEAGFAPLTIAYGVPAATEQWRARRTRPEYRKDFDYQNGRHPDGTVDPSHIRSWGVQPPSARYDVI
jgi:Family of unknown function (DUF6065)